MVWFGLVSPLKEETHILIYHFLIYYGPLSHGDFRTYGPFGFFLIL